MELVIGVDRVHFFDSTDHADLTAFATFYNAKNLNLVPDFARAKIGGTWYLLERVRATAPVSTQWEIRGTVNEDGSPGAPITTTPTSRQLQTHPDTGTKTATFTCTDATQMSWVVTAGTVTVNGIAYVAGGTIFGGEENGNGDTLPVTTFTFSASSSMAFKAVRYVV